MFTTNVSLNLDTVLAKMTVKHINFVSIDDVLIDVHLFNVQKDTNAPEVSVCHQPPNADFHMNALMAKNATNKTDVWINATEFSASQLTNVSMDNAYLFAKTLDVLKDFNV